MSDSANDTLTSPSDRESSQRRSGNTVDLSDSSVSLFGSPNASHPTTTPSRFKSATMPDTDQFEDDVEELIARQGRQFESIERSYATFTSSDGTTSAKATVRINYINSIWQRCVELDERIHNIIPADQDTSDIPYFRDSWFATKETLYLTMLEKMHEFATTASVTAAAVSHGIITPAEPARRLVHVPQLKLPRFSGNFEDWATFRDYFESLIIQDKSFDNLHRLHYLKSCLDGEAARVLKNVQVTADNFNSAWNALKSRFDNKRKLINLHLNNLVSLRSVTSESPIELRNLIGTTTEAINALKNLGRSVETWDDFLVFNIVQKFDRSTRKAWELSLEDSVEYPTFTEVESFLNSRIQALESLAPMSSGGNDKSSSKSPQAIKDFKPKVHHGNSKPVGKSPICATEHSVYKCSALLNTPIDKRFELIRQYKLCSNCLSSGHFYKNCGSKHVCVQCHKRHHTLLHTPPSTQHAPEIAPQVEQPLPQHFGSLQTSSAPAGGSVLTHFASNVKPSHIMLATAWVVVSCASQRSLRVRALLDQGSTSSFVTAELAEALAVPTIPIQASLTGIGNAAIGKLDRIAPIIVHPRNGHGPPLATDAFVIDSLTSYIPRVNFSVGEWTHLQGLEFADENPASADPIHLLIGADLYAYLLRDGLRRGEVGQPVAQNTVFGWVLSGGTFPMPVQPQLEVRSFHCQASTALSDIMSQFWDIEHVLSVKPLSPDETRCSEHFRGTHSRRSDGRYVVRIPFKSDPPIQLGESRVRAERSLLSVERRLARNQADRELYSQFMREYEDMGHMQRVPSHDDSHIHPVYLPHHPVLKTTSTTTKLRVMFNASSKTTNGQSLNDHQLTGPKLQQDLALLLTRWRSHRYVYTADVEKMYRQIVIDERDLQYQRILWRHDVTSPIVDYQLLTVTYGTCSAPYLAQRVLQQLVDDEGHEYPLAAPVVRHDFYVDDCLFGSCDRVMARQIRDQLVDLMHRGGFELRKWASNDRLLMQDIESDNHGLACDKALQSDDGVKILGLHWSPASDTYKFAFTPSDSGVLTKRAVLSSIARLFDPLGWISPVIIVAKIFMQTLWTTELTWDSPLSRSLACQWTTFYESLSHLNDLSIPRWTGQGPHVLRASLHGFADASSQAYGAVIYLRVESCTGEINVSLILSKTRVAPLKTQSIPRLELCAAALLARTLDGLRTIPEYAALPYHCWADATIVLHWLSKHASSWSTFVANRVSLISRTVPDATWRHVCSAENPADMASRGFNARSLIESTLWWHGPPWLATSESSWPSQTPPLNSAIPLEERHVSHAAIAISDMDLELSKRFSSWPRFLRVVARVTRLSPRSPYYSHRRSCFVSAGEIREVSTRWLRALQTSQFPEELARLTQQQQVDKHSSLASLNPYLDDTGLFRVGGRLHHAPLASAARHPVVLRNHHITKLLIRNAHQRCLHGGVSLTLHSLRNEFWILQAKKLIRSVIFHCVACARADVATQLMGQLPAVRVTPTERPFVHCGLDYAGPLRIRMAGGRGNRSQPAYIAVFVCMAVKAVHLEVVSDYTSSALIAAMRRFAARRGIPTRMYSDNGTTMHGADRELRDAYRQAIADERFRGRLATDRIEWSFIPPAAAHFGGL